MRKEFRTTSAIRYVLRADLPDGEVVVPIETPTGTVMAVREGEMTPALVDALNATLDYVTTCGLWERKE